MPYATRPNWASGTTRQPGKPQGIRAVTKTPRGISPTNYPRPGQLPWQRPGGDVTWQPQPNPYLPQQPGGRVPFAGQYPLEALRPIGMPWQQPQPQAQSQPAAQPQQAPPPQMLGPPVQVASGVQPQPVFPADYTQQAGMLAAALGVPSRYDLVSAYQRPGISATSPFIQTAMGADWARQMAQAQAAPGMIAQAHGLANLGQDLAYRGLADRSALGWGQLGLQNLQNQLDLYGRQQGVLAQMMSGLNRWV